MTIYGAQANRKLPGSEHDVNWKWVGSEMRGIYKRRALALCDFFWLIIAIFFKFSGIFRTFVDYRPFYFIYNAAKPS